MGGAGRKEYPGLLPRYSWFIVLLLVAIIYPRLYLYLYQEGYINGPSVDPSCTGFEEFDYVSHGFHGDGELTLTVQNPSYLPLNITAVKLIFKNHTWELPENDFVGSGAVSEFAQHVELVLDGTEPIIDVDARYSIEVRVEFEREGFSHSDRATCVGYMLASRWE